MPNKEFLDSMKRGLLEVEELLGAEGRRLIREFHWNKKDVRDEILKIIARLSEEVLEEEIALALKELKENGKDLPERHSQTQAQG